MKVCIINRLRADARGGYGNIRNLKDAADEIELLRKALIEIRDSPRLDPEGNSQIARKALESEE